MTKRFKILKDVVIDHVTGLEWQRRVVVSMSWGEAMRHSSWLSLDGHRDWRLPTIKELFTLIDYECFCPASKFPGMESEWYWSSSPYSDSSSYSSPKAWVVYFHNGLVHPTEKSISHLVRCVRCGPRGIR